MPSVGFESTISASERPQTYALDRMANGTGYFSDLSSLKNSKVGGLMFEPNEGFGHSVLTCRQVNTMRLKKIFMYVRWGWRRIKDLPWHLCQWPYFA
jgi:hypothetical protein